MLIINTGDNNNKVVMDEISAERMAEIEHKLFALQAPGDPEPPIMRLYPAEYYKQFTREEILNFAWKHGIYQFPTQELIDFLKSEIDPPKTIEIAAGGGHVGKHLPGVILTDNKLQEEAWVRDFYRAAGQHPIKYPSWMVKLDAEQAIEIYRPETVLGCWTVEAGTSASGKGINEISVASKVKKYIIVGNNYLHHKKPVLHVARAIHKLQMIKPTWLVSKASMPEENCIYLIDKLG